MNRTNTQTLEIAVLPGDGIGAEVMSACLELLKAAQEVARTPALHCVVHERGRAALRPGRCGAAR